MLVCVSLIIIEGFIGVVLKRDLARFERWQGATCMEIGACRVGTVVLIGLDCMAGGPCRSEHRRTRLDSNLRRRRAPAKPIGGTPSEVAAVHKRLLFEIST